MNDAQLLERLAKANSFSEDASLPEAVWTRDLALREIERRTNMSDTDLREGTEVKPTTAPAHTRRGWVVALGVFVAVLAIGGLLFTLNRNTEPGPADPTPTTIPATTTTAVDSAVEADVAVVEAAVAAWYGGDFDSVRQLFRIPAAGGEMEGWTEEQMRQHMEYDVALSTQADGFSCTAPLQPGLPFGCTYTLRDALTEAIGLGPPPGGADQAMFRVVDGVVADYELGISTFITRSYGVLLALDGSLAGYEDCLQPPLNAGCAAVRLERVDEWADWRQNASMEELARAHFSALFDGNCSALWAVSDNPGFPLGDCPDNVQYEVAMSGQLELRSCEVTTEGVPTVTCDALYSNVLHTAVGAAPVSTEVAVELGPSLDFLTTSRIVSSYPQDLDLLDSWRDWATAVDRVDELDGACGPVHPRVVPECATFMLDNIDAWTGWYTATN